MHPLHHPLFIQYIVNFNYEKDFFECHEVGEDYWKSVAPKDKMHPLTGWIQLAVGMYHWRRSNYQGALRSFIRAKVKLSDGGIWVDGVDHEKLIGILSDSIKAVTERQPFWNQDIPITDEQLKSAIRCYRSENPATQQDAYFLMHKHRLRDRSSIISLREQKKRRNL